MIVVTLAILVTACATRGHPPPPAGVTTTISGHSYDAIWQAAVRAARAQFDILDSDQNLGIIAAERRGARGASGSSFHILISPPLAGAAAYRVEVVAGTAGRASREWARQVIRHIRDLLEAKSLPPESRARTRHGHRAGLPAPARPTAS